MAENTPPSGHGGWDFSEYGIPAREWLDFIAAHPEAGGEDCAPPAVEARPAPPDGETADSRRNFGVENDEEAAAVWTEEVHIREDTQGKAGIKTRLYMRQRRDDELELDKVPGVVYFPGGGDVFGGEEGMDGYLCRLAASRLRVVVVQVCYGTSRGHELEDGKEAFEWLLRRAGELGVDAEQIVVVGLAAGAGVAASMALRIGSEDAESIEAEQKAEDVRPRKMRKTEDREDVAGEDGLDGLGMVGKDEQTAELRSSDVVPPEDKVFDRTAPFAGRRKQTRRIRGMLLGLPWLMQESDFPSELFRSREVTSRIQCAEATRVSKSLHDRLAGNRSREGMNRESGAQRNHVLLATDKELARFPRTALMIAGMDMFRDDGLLLAGKLDALGVPRRVHMFSGMPHEFRRYSDLWSSKRFDELFLLLLNWALDRAVSSADHGFHVERQEDDQPGKQSQESKHQEPPFQTRVTGT